MAVAALVASRSYSTSSPVSTGMGDRLRTGNSVCNQPPRPAQLPTLSGRKMSTGQSALRLGVKAGMTHSICECTCGSRQHVSYLRALEVSFLGKKRYRNVLFIYSLTRLRAYVFR